MFGSFSGSRANYVSIKTSPLLSNFKKICEDGANPDSSQNPNVLNVELVEKRLNTRKK